MKTAIMLMVSVLVIALTPGIALAAPGDDDVLGGVCRDTPNAVACQDNVNQGTENNAIYGPNGILTRAVNLLSIGIGIAAVIMIILGGFQYILSNGDPAAISGAKNTILYALVGLLIAAIAQGIIGFVLRRL